MLSYIDLINLYSKGVGLALLLKNANTFVFGFKKPSLMLLC